MPRSPAALSRRGLTAHRSDGQHAGDSMTMSAAANTAADRKALTFAMNLSLAVGLVMFVMKVGAYMLTGSAAILSDAAESVVHVAAVIFAVAIYMLIRTGVPLWSAIVA